MLCFKLFFWFHKQRIIFWRICRYTNLIPVVFSFSIQCLLISTFTPAEQIANSHSYRLQKLHSFHKQTLFNNACDYYSYAHNERDIGHAPLIFHTVAVQSFIYKEKAWKYNRFAVITQWPFCNHFRCDNDESWVISNVLNFSCAIILANLDYLVLNFLQRLESSFVNESSPLSLSLSPSLLIRHIVHSN